MTRDHTYARFRDRRWMLYNDVKDPYQVNNLIDDPEYESVREQMEEQLQAYLDETKDPFCSTEAAYEKYVVDKVIVSEDKEELAHHLLNEYAGYNGSFVPDDKKELTTEMIESMSHYLLNESARYFEANKTFEGYEDFFDFRKDYVDNARYVIPMLENHKIRTGREKRKLQGQKSC